MNSHVAFLQVADSGNIIAVCGFPSNMPIMFQNIPQAAHDFVLDCNSIAVLQLLFT